MLSATTIVINSSSSFLVEEIHSSLIHGLTDEAFSEIY